MARCKTVVWAASLFCLAAVPIAIPQEPSPDATPSFGGASESEHHEDGHSRMLRTLEGVRIRSAAENIYTGSDILAEERAELEELSDHAPATVRAKLVLSVGKDDLRLGDNRQAVERLREAYDLTEGRDIEVTFQLAVAFMRLGESRNCIHHRDPASCILPIREGGIHREQTGARNAIRYLTEVLDRKPDHLAARWLLNVAAMAIGEHPAAMRGSHVIPQERFASEADFPRFRDVAADRGLALVSLSGGAVADDFDNDGWLDVVVSDWSPSGQLRYFRNSGDGTFVDRTEQAGLPGLFGGLNLVQADFDNDGDVDLLVLRGAWLEQAGRKYPNSLLRNIGRGRFRDVTLEAGLAGKHFPTQAAAWADYDNDGFVDLYIGNEYAPSQLFRNRGDGTFDEVARDAGVTNDDFAKAAIWGDYDGDADPDLYVSNFGGPNRLYRNNGDGTFTDVAPELELALPLRSFPAWFWDYDNDGALDLFVAGYEWDVSDVAARYLGLPALETESDRLYRGDGRGGFSEVGSATGTARITQPMGSNFGDLDNDGFPDFYLGTGYPAYEGLMPNLLFHNDAGNRFVDVTAAAGVGHLQKGHGVVFADFDHDGDQDLFVELGGAYAGDVYANALFENPGFGNRWIAVKLEGTKSNRSGIGARIRADISEFGENRTVYKWVNSGGSFGANPLRQHIGLGKAVRIDTLEVYWPTSGLTQRFVDVPTNRLIAIEEGNPEYRRLPYGPGRNR